MSLTIMTASRIKIRDVTMGRRPETRASGRLFGGIIPYSRRVRDEARGLPGADCLDFRQAGTGRHDHAPAIVERARAQFEPEQPLALERTGQQQLAGLLGGEAEAGVV